MKKFSNISTQTGYDYEFSHEEVKTLVDERRITLPSFRGEEERERFENVDKKERKDRKFINEVNRVLGEREKMLGGYKRDERDFVINV